MLQVGPRREMTEQDGLSSSNRHDSRVTAVIRSTQANALKTVWFVSHRGGILPKGSMDL